MATTEPADLGGNRYDGKSETTDLTNEMAPRPGYPCETESGEIVLVVDEVALDPSRARTKLIAEDGREFTLRITDGKLVPFEAAETVAAAPAVVEEDFDDAA